MKTGSKSGGCRVLIENRQRQVRLDRAAIRRDAHRLLAILGIPDRELSLLFVDDPGIRALNRDWLRRDRVTNVIAFPQSVGDYGGLNPSLLGDVAVSVEAARREAQAAGIPLEDALFYLVLHGVLHLAGY